jgi:hypothetical protein
MKFFLRVAFAVLTSLFAAFAIFALFNLPYLEQRTLELGINYAAREYFGGSIRLQNVKIDKNLKLQIEGLEGRFRTRSGPLPVEAQRIRSNEPLTHLFLQKPVTFGFEAARPKHSAYNGIHGSAVYKGGKEWEFRLDGDIEGIGLEDLTPLSPESLTGSSGSMKGRITLASDARHDPAFGLELRVEEPGGKMQARFFDLLLPYLPQIQTQRKIEKLSGTAKLVAYRKASFQMNLVESDRIKMLLQIEVPEYNLNLNLNMEIRVDRKNALSQIAQIMGLVEVAVQ